MTATDSLAVKTVDNDMKAPLEDLMVAMDVTDMIRHRNFLVDRELNADARRENLRGRLREIYTAQGIEVSDEALNAGIAALDEERFRYEAADGGFSIWLAKLYVTRDRWGKRVSIIGLIAIIVFSAWLFTEYLPNQKLRNELPDAIQTSYAAIVASTDDPAAIAQATELNTAGRNAVASGEFATAQRSYDQLQTLSRRLQEIYDVRIVSRQNELSGVWRVPNVNEAARNYYLIVEAVAPTGSVISVPIASEEDGQTRLVQKWGVRVSAETFDAVSADKLDDGIIQNNLIGAKTAGQMTPNYRIPLAGGTITEW